MENIRPELNADSEAYFNTVMQAAKQENRLSAKHKLAELYRRGGAAEKNSAEALRWYSLAAIQAVREYDEKETGESAAAAVNALWELGDFDRELKNFSGAESAFRRMEELCINLPDEIKSDESQRWLAVSCNKLGSLCERGGDAESALEYYKRALAISEELAQKSDSESIRDDLAVACYRAGFIEYLFSGRREKLDKAHGIWNELYGETQNYEYRRRGSVIDTLYATAEVPQSAEQPPQTEETEEIRLTEAEPKRPVRISRGGFWLLTSAAVAAAVFCMWLIFRAFGQ